ncbi:MAG: NAD-binding protein [Desulfobacterales bacterium]|nr:NAD-binding protein [Desulfofustis sp.]MBT8361438.1 NAD-binding protein [Deltaproteobacteria bacterium]NNK96445.1 NAD-binding protein [Desulfobacterales bacterium]
MERLCAFIGLGIMGKPMAKNLLAKGFDLFVSDVNVDAIEEVIKAGAESKSLSEIGAECDVIFTCLPSGEVVQEVLFGDGGVSSTIKKEVIVVDHSSVTPEQAKYCGNRLKELGVYFLDAPVSGGEPKAITGELAIMAGGNEDVFNKLIPCFEAIGSSATRTGDVGSGSVAKLANQIIVNLSIAVVSEAMVFVEKAGADPNLVYEAIRGGLAGSTVLDAKVPLMTSRNFQPGGKISINHKDITNVLSSAHKMDIPVPLTAQLYEIMQTLKVMGCMDEDHGAIVKYFEMLADVEVGSKFKK